MLLVPMLLAGIPGAGTEDVARSPCSPSLSHLVCFDVSEQTGMAKRAVAVQTRSVAKPSATGLPPMHSGCGVHSLALSSSLG